MEITFALISSSNNPMLEGFGELFEHDNNKKPSVSKSSWDLKYNTAVFI